MNQRPELCKKIELASYYFEDGSVGQAIITLENCIIEMKSIQRNRNEFYAKLQKQIKK